MISMIIEILGLIFMWSRIKTDKITVFTFAVFVVTGFNY
jgi:hypothetical protein